jgi:hypothetical protein
MRARDFLKGMTLLQDDAEYRYSSALLAIHGAISYSDALRVGLGDTGTSSDNHQNAATELRKQLMLRKYDRQQGISRLEKLLRRKTTIAYSGDSVSEQEVKSIIQQAERFAVWAETTGSELKIERWRND